MMSASSRNGSGSPRRALRVISAIAVLAAGTVTTRAESARTILPLDTGWRTELAAALASPAGPEQAGFDDDAWRAVDVPHNWDSYEGARQTRHGNLHGSAWYRRTFSLPEAALADGRRAFLFFEGVGSYATVWVNGREVGRHAGGLTTFTLDVTDAVRRDDVNTLVVRADHPSGIRDLPWVCGGCELVYGFSEGPQPFGIFRPVALEITAPVRIEPFGIHVWHDDDATAARATVHCRTEIRNHGATPRTVELRTAFVAAEGGTPVRESRTTVTLAPGESRVVQQDPAVLENPRLWSPEQPHQHRVVARLVDGNRVIDEDETLFGIRSVVWPDPDGAPDVPLLINGRPVFLNGTCDYEHNLGANHAFSEAQVVARASQIRAAGFNAFRDAHHPHNLRFGRIWDSSGTLWWTQFGAQIWFDSDEFRTNYIRLLRQWVKERRNSPSLILWGLQNESKLPTAFARACADVIREMDPTASTQRLITTCNGGTGTDWNVPQNWTGTYGGDPATYADDLRRQRLVGEYGAWRSLGLHSEGGYQEKGPLSEDRLNALLETKIRLADTVRDRVVGHFHWPFTTHANPGRNFGERGEQLHDGIRPLDHIGPANNKGMFTLWGEPTDAYHLYRANFTDPATNPMVAIMSRTWPHRWTEPGRKSGIVVYSNGEEVELFNDLGGKSLGVRTRAGRGTHFAWDDVPIEYNLLYAEARVGGRVVATDAILLHHLPEAPGQAAANAAEDDLLAHQAGGHYLHRINCGGPEYRDRHGHTWSADRGFATSWADTYTHLPAEFGSQRRIHEPISGTRDDPLFQTFRYGRDALRYVLPVPDGRYDVEFYFLEPWYGAGGERDCRGWRRFDILVNGRVAVAGVDPWSASRRHAQALRESVPVEVSHGRIEISFAVDAGQAVLSAIAVRKRSEKEAHVVQTIPSEMSAASPWHTHLDLGDRVYQDSDTTLADLPRALLEADLLRTPASGDRTTAITFEEPSHVYLAHDMRIASKPAWLVDWERTGEQLTTVGADAATFDLLRTTVAAGGTVAFGLNQDQPEKAGAAMYLVLRTPARPLPEPQFIEMLDTDGADRWKAHGHVKSGHPLHTDGTVRFTGLPGAFGDGDWILPPAQDDELSAAFTASVPIEVALGVDPRMTRLPAWMEHWIPTTSTISNSSTETPRLRVLRQRFGPGQPVHLGDRGRLPNDTAAATYAVLVRPVRESVTFPVARDEAGTHWRITVQVGDRYGLNFRTRNPNTEPRRIPYAIIASDEAEVCSGTFDIPPAAASTEWQIARTRTCDSLNAGTYTLRVLAPADSPASIVWDTLEVE